MTYNKMSYNSIRIAYCGSGEGLGAGMWDDFLQRAKNSRYNYVLAEFAFDRGANTSMQSKKEDFKKAFSKVDKFGLRLIPLIQMGSCWSDHWKYANDNWGANIQMNRVNGKNNGGYTKFFGCPSFAEDQNGIDKTFQELLVTIKSAYTEASVSYPLEFIHLGHDEPSFYQASLIGGVTYFDKAFHSDQSWETYSLNATYSQADRDFINNRINNFGEKVETAFSTLMVNEIYRRVKQIKLNINDNVKLIIYGDAWDPQMNGPNFQLTYLSKKKYNINGKVTGYDNCFKTTPQIRDLPGLNSNEKKDFKENVILMPWNYSENCVTYWPTDLSKKTWVYNTNNTFKFLRAGGFKFMYLHEIIDGKDTNSYRSSNPPGYPQDRISQAKAFTNTSFNYNDNCLGFGAAAWEWWTNPIPKCYESIEYLYNLNSKKLPVVDFKTDTIN